MKVIKSIALAGLAAFAFSGMMAASAGAVTVGHPSDPSIAEYVSGNGIRSCDNQVDGNRARAWFGIAGVGNQASPYWAPSGGCSAWYPGSANMIRVCVENEGCGTWRHF
jgi:hypothetical protein